MENNTANRTRDYIQEAMMRLLAEKSFSEITVTELVKKAGVARVSYYRNYKHLDQVVDEALARQQSLFLSEATPIIEKGGEEEWRGFIRNFFETIKTNNHFYEGLRLHNPAYAFPLNFKEDQDSAFPLDPASKYFPSIAISIIATAAKQWFVSGSHEDIDEMSGLIYRAIMGLKSGLQQH